MQQVDNRYIAYFVGTHSSEWWPVVSGVRSPVCYCCGVRAPSAACRCSVARLWHFPDIWAAAWPELGPAPPSIYNHQHSNDSNCFLPDDWYFKTLQFSCKCHQDPGHRTVVTRPRKCGGVQEYRYRGLWHSSLQSRCCWTLHYTKHWHWAPPEYRNMGHMKATVSSVPAPGSLLSSGATAHCSHPGHGHYMVPGAALVTTWSLC